MVSWAAALDTKHLDIPVREHACPPQRRRLEPAPIRNRRSTGYQGGLLSLHSGRHSGADWCWRFQDTVSGNARSDRRLRGEGADNMLNEMRVHDHEE